MYSSISYHSLIITDETPAACEIALTVSKKCTESELNHPDSSKRTALHLACIERLPEVVKILVEDERTEVMRVDERKRTALHYAAENGTYFYNTYLFSKKAYCFVVFTEILKFLLFFIM